MLIALILLGLFILAYFYNLLQDIHDHISRIELELHLNDSKTYTFNSKEDK